MAQRGRQVVWGKPVKPQPVLPGAGKKLGGPQVLQQTSLPKTKPKPPRKEVKKTKLDKTTSSESQYAELRPVRADSIDHYAALSVATRTTQPGASGGTNARTEQAENSQERHYSNVQHTKRAPAYENHEFPSTDTKDTEIVKPVETADDVLKNDKKPRGCFQSHGKLILVLGLAGVIVLLIGLILLSIAIAGLAGASQNSKTLQELQANLSRTALIIQQMETDVGETKSSIFYLRSEAKRLSERVNNSDSIIKSQETSFEKELEQQKSNFSEQFMKQRKNISDLESRLDKTYMQDAMITSLREWLQGNITYIGMDLTSLNHSLTDTYAQINELNESIWRLKTFSRPISCNSIAYQGMAINSSTAYTNVTNYNNQDAAHCRAALYIDQELFTDNSNYTMTTSIKSTSSNMLQCTCELLNNTDIWNTVLVCTMTITTCTT